MASKLSALWNHPAGPKTIHFWAPTWKWGISVANVADFSKPPENISYPQQVAVTATGVIWSRYAMVIVPKNYILFACNISMFTTGIYQLSRKLRQDYMGIADVPLKKILTGRVCLYPRKVMTRLKENQADIRAVFESKRES